MKENMLKKKRFRKRRARKRKDVEEIFQDNDPEESNEVIPEDPICLKAVTALIIPVSYETMNTNLLLNEITNKKLTLSDTIIPFWVPVTCLPNEINDLSPQFKQFIGASSIQKTWTCNKFNLNPDILLCLFSKVRLYASSDDQFFMANIFSIELSVYPLGIAILSLHINWTTPIGELTLSDMRTILFVVKHMNIVGDVCKGWGLSDRVLSNTINILEFEKYLSPDIYSSIFNGTLFSLKSWSAWLLQLPGFNSPAPRLNVLRNAFHHSLAVVDRELPNDILMEYLFHMRRGFGQTNRPPVNSASTLGRVLVWRQNRSIGISREGIISLSWPLQGEHNNRSIEYETKIWPKKMMGIYLILSIHVYGEKMVFNELSDLAVRQAEYFQNVLSSSKTELKLIKDARDQLRNLATNLARFTLGMSSSDCGGTTEYSEYFVNLRREFGIPELRSEISEELKDVLAVVESNYLEEERAKRDHEELLRIEKYDREKEYQLEREQKLRRLELFASMAAAFTLPFVVISGIFGMNLSDLPDPPFWLTMSITFFIAFIFILCMVVLNIYQKSVLNSMIQNHQNREEYSVIKFQESNSLRIQ